MKRSAVIFATFILLSLIFSHYVFCSEPDKDGYVIYHQDFSGISDISETGIRKGTDGQWGFYLGISDGNMIVDNYNDQKAYILLPDIMLPETYTVVFTYRFTDVVSSNAYTGFMLTCSGDKPTNVTSAVIRANGECDEFGSLSSSLSEKIKDGNEVKVTIPIEKGNLHELQVSCSGINQTLIRENIVSITPEKVGFIVRNSSVAISEVYLIKGTDLDSIIGSDFDKSMYEVDNFLIADKRGETEIAAPATFDVTIIYLSVALFSGVAIFALLYIRKRRFSG